MQSLTQKPMVYANWSYLVPRKLLEPLLGTLTWNLAPFWNLHLEPLVGTSEPLGTFTQNPNLELANLPKPYLYLKFLLETWLGTLIWNLATSSNLASLEPPGSFSWNPSLEAQNLPEPGTLSGLEPSLETFYLEPWDLLDPLLGTLAWTAVGEKIKKHRD